MGHFQDGQRRRRVDETGIVVSGHGDHQTPQPETALCRAMSRYPVVQVRRQNQICEKMFFYTFP